MGMAASQSRFLQLTCRKNDIGYELTRLSNDKVSLTRDMQKVSRDYHNALSQKTLKWSNNSGVSYIDLNYNNLMKPSTMNNYTPYLLTDTNDRVVISTNYERYAKMLSANGLPGGNWNSVRTQVLSELTGIDMSKIDGVDASNTNVQELEKEVNRLIDNEPRTSPSFRMTSFSDILEKMGNFSIGLLTEDKGTWEDKYNSNAGIFIGSNTVTAYNEYSPDDPPQEATVSFTKTMDAIATSLRKYFPGKEAEFNSVIDLKKQEYLSVIETNADRSGSAGALTGRNAIGYTINIKTLIDEIEGALIHSGCESYTKADGYPSCVWYDVDSEQYATWKEKHDEWEQQYQDAKNRYNTAVSDNAKLLTAEERSLIAFYDTIFSTIADKGWTRNKQVEDSDYLNQMLQNNLYTITSVKTEDVYNFYTGKNESKNSYRTDLASNFSKIFTVNDTEAREEALAIYENKKSIINEKENRIDVRMKNLETEQSAINQMLQGLEQVKKNNIERTFNITG